jgi:ACT domain-containing protein
MLSVEQVNSIPRTTRHNWDNYQHDDYFGYEMAKDYIQDFDYIKEVLVSKHLKRGIKMMCTISNGYKGIMSEIIGSKKLLRQNAENISYSIARIAKYGKLKVADASKIFGVSRHWFYRHRKKVKCGISKIGKCFKQYSGQLTFQEVQGIERVVSMPENQGKTKTTLFYDSIRKGIVTCGLSTFFKYADLVGYEKRKKKQTQKHRKGYRATRPFEALHVDVTHVQTQNSGIQYVAFVKDNYSKALLHFKSTSNYADSNFIRDLFEETFTKYHLLDASDSINIVSDGGPENKGSLLEWINQIQAPPVVRKITANTPDFPFSNSMSESTHSIYKTEFMNRKFSFDSIQHFKDLERFMIYYNFERYPTEHFGLTPIEVLEGQKPHRNRFSERIMDARKKRIEKNRVFNNCCILR